jgi:pyruvate formate lyase activating enzyme
MAGVGEKKIEGGAADDCRLKEQGFEPGSCRVAYGLEKIIPTKPLFARACKVTLKWEGDIPFRLIESAHLSRPEHYFSIYQSGCNFTCKKCHSWYFTQCASGQWMCPKDIGILARDYAKTITYWEPRERATSFHAHDLCLCCGLCVTEKKRSPDCPGVLEPDQVLLSPQGWGPARNIIGFTGGDLTCQPEFYCSASEEIKRQREDLWILLETNGYGLTPKNLDRFNSSGIDAFWLDIKAYDNEVHRSLTGCSNERILGLPYEIKKRGFALEVLSLFIPGWVEADQIGKIAQILLEVDPQIPYTILAFFPEYQLKDVPSPTLTQMLAAYIRVKEVGLKNVRLGNIGIFVRTEKDLELLRKSTTMTEEGVRSALK